MQARPRHRTHHPPRDPPRDRPRDRPRHRPCVSPQPSACSCGSGEDGAMCQTGKEPQPPAGKASLVPALAIPLASWRAHDLAERAAVAVSPIPRADPPEHENPCTGLGLSLLSTCLLTPTFYVLAYADFLNPCTGLVLKCTSCSVPSTFCQPPLPPLAPVGVIITLAKPTTLPIETVRLDSRHCPSATSSSPLGDAMWRLPIMHTWGTDGHDFNFASLAPSEV